MMSFLKIIKIEEEAYSLTSPGHKVSELDYRPQSILKLFVFEQSLLKRRSFVSFIYTHKIIEC